MKSWSENYWFSGFLLFLQKNKKMNPRVKSVKAESNYVLLLEFSNGEKKRFDVSPYIGKGVFAPLSDESFFRKVKVFLGSIQWPNGADLCPDTLYLDSIAI